MRVTSDHYVSNQNINIKTYTVDSQSNRIFVHVYRLKNTGIATIFAIKNFNFTTCNKRFKKHHLDQMSVLKFEKSQQ